MLKEFKEFIAHGNVMDMAIGVVMGSAFTAIVNAIVDGLLNPLIGVITAGVAVDSLTFDFMGVVFQYGLVLSSIIKFLVIALVLFTIVKSINKLKRQEPPADPTTKTCPFCFTEIDINAVKCPNCTADL